LSSRKKINWPDGKKFAFTIFDDTDNANLTDVKAVYDLLNELGFKTTKSVWVLPPTEKPRIGGSDLSNQEYRDYVKFLDKEGFEIALHNATATHSKRIVTLEAFEKFKEYFRSYPKSFANHADNRENIYWGSKRLSGILRSMFSLISSKTRFEGEVEDSPYFWGDICKEHIQYIRNFVFENINTEKADPYTPYRDSSKKYSNRWFSSTNAGNVKTFNLNVNRKSITQLEVEGGFSIIYTHFCSFAKDGVLDPTFESNVRYLAKKDGWFVPVSDLLDFLSKEKGVTDLTRIKRFNLEAKWLFEQIIKKMKSISL
jgi:hypothetical protein